MQNSYSLVDWRQPAWLAASVAFSLGFACAVPLAAFAALGALTLDRRMALILIVGVVLANQIVGFTLLHYPWTAVTLAWSPAFLVVGLTATLAATWIKDRIAGFHPLAVAPLTFLAAFAVYEGIFFLISLLTANSLYPYRPAIMFGVFELNAVAFSGLFVLHRIAAAAGFAGRHRAIAA